MAFCNADDLHGRVIDATEEGFDTAMNVSCHSFLRMAKALEPLDEPTVVRLITMSYLGAERVVRNYGVMGIIKAALESAVRYMAYDLGPKGIRVFAVSPWSDHDPRRFRHCQLQQLCLNPMLTESTTRPYRDHRGSRRTDRFPVHLRFIWHDGSDRLCRWRCPYRRLSEELAQVWASPSDLRYARMENMASKE
jgi:NAD(P)-dependent dehydrogenase (short-subunit alcohol dehydrogenase family)